MLRSRTFGNERVHLRRDRYIACFRAAKCTKGIKYAEVCRVKYAKTSGHGLRGNGNPNSARRCGRAFSRTGRKSGTASLSALRTQCFIPRKLEKAVKPGTEDQRREAEIVIKSAREYVRNTPAQVQTAVRKRLSAQPEWSDSAPSCVLFDPE
jgi:hypothetical protein